MCQNFEISYKKAQSAAQELSQLHFNLVLKWASGIWNIFDNAAPAFFSFYLTQYGVCNTLKSMDNNLYNMFAYIKYE